MGPIAKGNEMQVSQYRFAQALQVELALRCTCTTPKQVHVPSYMPKPYHWPFSAGKINTGLCQQKLARINKTGFEMIYS